METVSERIYALLCFALLLGLLSSLSVRFAGLLRFAFALLLLAGLLRPLGAELPLRGLYLSEAFDMMLKQAEEELTAVRDSACCDDIAARTSAYIERRAADMGLSVHAEVKAEMQNAVPIPVSVTLTGEKNEALAAWLRETLGLTAQEWSGCG